MPPVDLTIAWPHHRPRQRFRRKVKPRVAPGPSIGTLFIHFGDHRAVIDEKEFRLLEASNLANWHVSRGGSGQLYVRAADIGFRTGKASVAGLILDAILPGDRIGYRDGDHFNLRRSNLFFKSRSRLRKDRPEP
ncbi:MAG: hypothetical protein IT442_12335 [Phycisphaeraceae bacterium]|nr:hypothetical protein [Phycisphaeraceae bacterium]